MSTTLTTTVKTVDFGAFSDGARQLAIMRQNLGDEAIREQDLVRVPTPLGGATQWAVEIDGNVSTCDELVGLCVGVGLRGELWPTPDPSEQRPTIISHDLRVGYRVGDDLGDLRPEVLERYRTGDRTYDWVGLANSQELGWGSARAGGAKRCKEKRLLALLRDGDVWPVIVSVGPGSLSTVIPFFKRLPCFRYEAVVGLKLRREKGSAGSPYSQIVPRLVGQLSPEQGEAARVAYYEPIMRMFREPPAGFSALEDNVVDGD